MTSRVEDYAIIGDGRTAALVSCDGSIDWLCLPRFDSEACCAALVGTREHGYWQIRPVRNTRVERRYDGDTLVMHTDFVSESGRVRVADFMAVGQQNPVLIRRVIGLEGSLHMRCEVRLRFDYGLMPPLLKWSNDTLLAVSGPALVALHCPLALTVGEDDCAYVEFDVSARQVMDFVLVYCPSHARPPGRVNVSKALDATLTFWRDWIKSFQRRTEERDAVVRSLLTLKALSYHATGAMIAAPTTSLPEVPSGTSNWDYRYCWIRDATFTVSALLNAGFHQEAVQWRDWMLRAVGPAPDKMRIMYRLDGGRRLYEQPVPWLSGYQGATPVRVGNNAAAQRQVDVVGELLDALDLMASAGLPEPPDVVAAQRRLVQHLEDSWHDKGHGLWESRATPERYTYSAVMAWVGVDRFIRSAHRRHDQDSSLLNRMAELRDRIRHDIADQCWNHARQHFVDRFGGERLDASLLLLPLVNFLPPDEPRMSATIDAVERELSRDGLVWRMSHGGDADEGAFIACTCWLADCRAMQGRQDDARRLLDRVLSLRNDVGLLSEMYHPGLRRLIGNFPQALSHLALVNTALGLSGPVLQRGGG
jgi:GH15 family glucan-1,4-alpha-glucosidase